jgi:hypothetical protein
LTADSESTIDVVRDLFKWRRGLFTEFFLQDEMSLIVRAEVSYESRATVLLSDSKDKVGQILHTFSLVQRILNFCVAPRFADIYECS